MTNYLRLEPVIQIMLNKYTQGNNADYSLSLSKHRMRIDLSLKCVSEDNETQTLDLVIKLVDKVLVFSEVEQWSARNNSTGNQINYGEVVELSKLDLSYVFTVTLLEQLIDNFITTLLQRKGYTPLHELQNKSNQQT